MFELFLRIFQTIVGSLNAPGVVYWAAPKAYIILNCTLFLHLLRTQLVSSFHMSLATIQAFYVVWFHDTMYSVRDVENIYYQRYK